MLHCRLRMLLRATLLACSVLGFVACRLLLFILLSVAAETLDPSKDFTYHHLPFRSPRTTRALLNSPLHIPVGYWTAAAAATEAGAAPRLRLVVYVDFGVALINMQRYCKRTKRAKPKTNEQKQKIVGKISKKQKATNDAMSKFLPSLPPSFYAPLATGRVNI